MRPFSQIRNSVGFQITLSARQEDYMKTTMSNNLLLGIGFCMLILFSACLKDGDSTLVFPNAAPLPTDRPNHNQGTFLLPDKNIEIALWDHGTIDGDTISVIINQRIVISRLGLDGPDNKYTCPVTLDRKQNELVLFAHNEGYYSPNTAAISIKSGTFYEEKTLESDLGINASLTLIIDGTKQ